MTSSVTKTFSFTNEKGGVSKLTITADSSEKIDAIVSDFVNEPNWKDITSDTLPPILAPVAAAFVVGFIVLVASFFGLAMLEAGGFVRFDDTYEALRYFPARWAVIGAGITVVFGYLIEICEYVAGPFRKNKKDV